MVFGKAVFCALATQELSRGLVRCKRLDCSGEASATGSASSEPPINAIATAPSRIEMYRRIAILLRSTDLESVFDPVMQVPYCLGSEDLRHRRIR